MENRNLRAISKKANVSIATASRVLSGAKTVVKISEKTRKKVMEAAKELDYIPNVFAKSLRLRKSFTIGLVVSNIEDYFFGPIIRGVERNLKYKGYHLILADAEDDIEKETFCVHDLYGRMVDGILIAGIPAGYEKEKLPTNERKKVPLICIARQIDSHLPSVAIDNELGGFLATEHLIMLGHRRIGFLSGPPMLPDCQSRLAGYKSAFKKYGLKLDKNLIMVKNTSPLPETGYKAMIEGFLNKSIKMTACFAYNDFMAMGAMKALLQKGRKIPENFSIVGFDDILPAAYSTPPLTTVRQPLEEIGRRATSMLLNIISKPDSDYVGEKLVLQPKLIVRGSTRKI